MSDELSLHLVARDCSALKAFLRERMGCVRLREYSALPPRTAVCHHDSVVIFLDDQPSTCDPRVFLSALTNNEIWLVYGRGSVSALWLDATRHPNVNLVYCDISRGKAALEPLANALIQEFTGPRTLEIEAMVLTKEPVLTAAQPLIHAMCSDPWRVRHPSDLAQVAGVSLHSIKRTVRCLGFSRVEHFMTYVRWVAYQQLRAVRRLRTPLAKQLTGIVDQSNLRRQLARARQGSRQFFRQAQGLIVGALLAGLVACAERQVSLRGETQGTVQAVLARAGHHVDSGEVLVRLDPQPFDLAVREAESQLADAIPGYSHRR